MTQPTFVFHNGPVFDGTSLRHDVAVAVAGETIVAVGPQEAVRALTPGSHEVDLHGALLVPGFQDSHVHPILAAQMGRRLALESARSQDEILALVDAYVAAHPSELWIHGWGWNPEVFGPGQPTRALLDSVTGVHPAILFRADGHAAWVNSAAIRAAKLDSEDARAAVQDPPGGRIDRDSAGRATGLLHEWATDLVHRLVPEPSVSDAVADLLDAQATLFSHGITSWLDASVDSVKASAYASAADAGSLIATVVGALRWDHRGSQSQLGELVQRRGSTARARFRPTTVKVMLDGVVDGSLTAAMLDPYLGSDGAPSANSGDLYFTPQELREILSALIAEGFHVHSHVIGDRAVREFLDALEFVRNQGVVDLNRPALSHIQVIHPDDIGRFAELGAVASAQALWANGEEVQTELTMPFLGPVRSQWQYRFASLADQGAVLAGGSDWPVSTPDPLQAIHAAVNRQIYGEEHRPPLNPREALTVAQAVAAYTSGTAYALGLEGESGSIRAGLFADLAVVDRDIFTIPTAEIGSARVTATYVRGERVWHSAS